MVAPPLGAPGAGPLRLPGQCLRAGEPVLGARKGAGTPGPRGPWGHGPCFLPSGPCSVSLPHAWSVHADTHTCTSQAKTHAHQHVHHTPACAHTCSPAGPCITGLAKQQSERWGTWVPGKAGEPWASRSGAQPQLPCVAGGWEWKKGLLGPPKGSLSPGRLCTIGARVPSSLLAAPVLPASLEGSGPHTVGEHQ